MPDRKVPRASPSERQLAQLGPAIWMLLMLREQPRSTPRRLPDRAVLGIDRSGGFEAERWLGISA
ncbi:hypothetical protein BV511_11175 [Methylorubrum extorquens]|uniref:hypothetical protein n=1 Tax=Methylorubrum extorquens TaxID=408 RepID=UPI000972771A|nr:hypothetical protein [Methylorubrum extorquens]APX85216.1 hypothetical protein BV511_11175 [Methylorubrum extorquens]